jgi:oxygen-independent coproporphyrinogen-3 oxidase
MTLPDPATSGHESPETDVGSVFVSNYPPFSAWEPRHLGRVREALDAPPRPETPLGLYLHIPFCRKRCKFCYFRVYTDKNFDEIGAYLDALGREVELYAGRTAIADRPLEFVYFGGGTPSYISVEHLRALVRRIQAVMPWIGAREVTFECEPGTLTRSKLEAIREIGVTRLSLGIESFDDEILRVNGRAHVSKEIERCLPWIEELAFDQLNVDLIAGMVGETWATWRQTVARTVALAPDSVTIYQMELPFNTRFSHSLQAGELEIPLADWETKREWHAWAMDRLAEASYVVSSAYTMVRGDRASRFVYRDAVWHGCDLLGTGVASFSHLSGVHFQNVDGWGEYMARLRDDELPLGRALPTSADDRLTRELMLQLKLGRLDTTALRCKFAVDPLERFAAPLARLANRGLLTVDGSTIELTRKGLLKVDMLLPELYDARHRGARYT